MRALTASVMVLGLFLGGYLLFGANLLAPNTEPREVQQNVFKQALVLNNPEIDSAFIHLVFPSGGAQNPYAEGLAHYVEHLAWLSAMKGPDQTRALKAHSNAWTNLNAAGYWQQANPDTITQTVGSLARIAAPISLADTFAKQERDIVAREYDVRVTERPLQGVAREVSDLLFAGMPRGRSVIGRPDTIPDFDLAQAHLLHAQTHLLAQATLFAFGNIDAAKLQTAIAAIDAPSQNTAPLPVVAIIGNDMAPLHDTADVASPTAVQDTLIWRTLTPMPACGTALRCGLILEIAQDILDSTLPEGLAGALRFDNFVASQFWVTLRLAGRAHVEFDFVANPDSGVALDDLQAAFETTFRKTALNGVSDASFDRIHSRLMSDIDAVTDVSNYNKNSVLSALQTGDPMTTLSEERRTLKTITRQDVNALLHNLSTPYRHVVRRVTPER